MRAALGNRLNVSATLFPAAHYLMRPYYLLRNYDRANLKPDLMAGVTVAFIMLPQAIAFALIAELPPQFGLYTAVVGGIIGALWGSSNQMKTGPTNAISLLVLSVLLSSFIEPGTNEFLVAAGLMAVMAGIFQLIMGMARLGMLVNFVSHSVIVGFASGAGILIGIKQLHALFGLSVASDNIFQTVRGVVLNLPRAHIPTTLLGIGIILFIVIIRRINPRLPAAILGLVITSAIVFVAGLSDQGVDVIGSLPGTLPPLARLPLFNLDFITRLSTGALAVGAIGLVQTTAITRSVASQTGQRLDSNQEFVGQGIANIFSGLFSGYAVAGSFSITAVNFKGGAKTPIASIFASLFVLIAMLTLGSLTAFMPRAALAGILILTAYGMIDRQEIRRIWHSHPGDAAIMVLTMLGTLFLAIEFAVLAGIIFSLALYILRTSAPRVHAVLPTESFKHFTYQPGKEACPQLSIIEIQGDLYFGAVNHIEEFILNYADGHPEQRFLLLRMLRVNNCDFSGIHMLENVVRTYRDRGGDVFLVRTNYRVRQIFASSGFDQFLGEDHLLDDDTAIGYLFYRVLDPAVCIYECPVKVFKECQNLPKRVELAGIPLEHDIQPESISSVSPETLWQQLHRNGNGRAGVVSSNGASKRPYVIDVREPREFRQGHIAEAELMPLSTILAQEIQVASDQNIVLVCRSGRRSRRAAAALQNIGCKDVQVLKGGMLAWEAAGLLEAID